MKKKSEKMKKNANILKVIRYGILSCIAVCVITAIITTVNNKTNIQVSSKQAEEPKAIIVRAREKNKNNFTPITSLDGIEVPVPNGYVASSVNEERYVNGVNGTYKLQENLTLSSSGTYPWSQNETTGVWSSGNYQVASSTSVIETNEFTVNEAATVRINWSVCSQAAKNKDYAYYTITNTASNATIGGTGTQEARIAGTKYGTAEPSLIYVDKDILLEAGTYKVTITYSKDSDSTHQNLDKAYVKSIGVYTKSAEGSEITVREKSGGFVIYEGTDTVTESNVATAKKTRNQWVWVPVDDVKDLYHETNGVLYGNRWNFTAEKCTKNENYSYEPNVFTNNAYNSDNVYLKRYLEGITRNEFLAEMREEFYNMLESVATYGGFYIGRYETGNATQKVPQVIKGINNFNASGVTWYNQYKRCKNLKGNNKAVETGMIWGAQWDETLKWIAETQEKTYFEVGYDSTSWGNYTNSITSGAGKLQNTGYRESWKTNNIYDLAGNAYDWTMESDNIDERNFRGGRYYTSGYGTPAVHFGSYRPGVDYIDTSCRATLCII